jgi:hypothetical protein
MGNAVLRAETLSKRYTIAGEQAPYRTLRDDLTALVTWPCRRHARAAGESAELWALKDVSLEIERQGIRNGFSQIVQSASLETVSAPDSLTDT